MIFKVYAVFDRAAETFNTPMFFAAHGQALRAFADEANRPESQIHKHPDDYTLYSIGTYNSETGELVSKRPDAHGTGSDYIEMGES